MKKIARGSVLAYSLILLSILLIVSIGMMSSSIVDLKSLSSNDNSVNAFQIADSGSQAIVASIKKDNSGNIGDLATRMGLSCSNGLVESSLLNGAYKVSFYGDASTAPLSCADTLSGVTSVKSVGSYRDSARAVSVAVAAGSCGLCGGFIGVRSNPPTEVRDRRGCAESQDESWLGEHCVPTGEIGDGSTHFYHVCWE